MSCASVYGRPPEALPHCRPGQRVARPARERPRHSAAEERRHTTYHFAHIVDDHEMAVTHVIRGDEWLASLPTHVEIAQKLGFTVLPHAHIAPICKIDGEGKRKLSKRHDPEANVEYYADTGYPWVLCASTCCHSWARTSTPGGRPTPVPRYRLPVQMKLIAKSGSPLLDTAKLDFISRAFIARMTAAQVYQHTQNGQVIW
jgi:glutamyl-tRNA synthetase